ncbi:hypothetical protein BH20ACT5_BH20ACT5_03080 [soil metagenome]
MQRPDFPRPRRTRRGYDPGEVDRFIELVLARIDGRPDGEAVTAVDLGVMVFHESSRGEGYDTTAVDDWLQRVRPAVAEADQRPRGDDPPADSALALPAPAGVSDLFPRVSRVVPGYSVADVEALLGSLRQRLTDGDRIDPTEVRTAVLGEQKGGYRHGAVAEILDLLALALRR